MTVSEKHAVHQMDCELCGCKMVSVFPVTVIEISGSEDIDFPESLECPNCCKKNPIRQDGTK
jgi:hypothetical protein